MGLREHINDKAASWFHPARGSDEAEGVQFGYPNPEARKNATRSGQGKIRPFLLRNQAL
jgi:hypothetical protein